MVRIKFVNVLSAEQAKAKLPEGTPAYVVKDLEGFGYLDVPEDIAEAVTSEGQVYAVKRGTTEPAYLIRYSAKGKEPIMLPTWAKTRTEAINISFKVMESLEYDDAEIWYYPNVYSIAKTTRL